MHKLFIFSTIRKTIIVIYSHSWISTKNTLHHPPFHHFCPIDCFCAISLMLNLGVVHRSSPSIVQEGALAVVVLIAIEHVACVWVCSLALCRKFSFLVTLLHVRVCKSTLFDIISCLGGGVWWEGTESFPLS